MGEQEMNYESFCNILKEQGYVDNKIKNLFNFNGDVTLTKDDTTITINKNNFNSNATVTITNQQYIPTELADSYQDVSSNGLTTHVNKIPLPESGAKNWNKLYIITTSKEIPVNELLDSDDKIDENQLNFGYEDVMPVVNDVPLEGTTDDGTEAAEAAQSPETPVAQSPETQAAQSPETPVEPSNNSNNSNVYNNYTDFEERVRGLEYSLVGLNIPNDADSYEIKDGKVIVTKSGESPREYLLHKFFVSNSYTIEMNNMTFDVETLKGKLNNINISVDDIKNVRSKAIELLQYFDDKVLKLSKEIVDNFPSINELTKEKLISYGLDVDYLIYIYNSHQNTIAYHLNDVIESLAQSIEANLATNDNGKGTETGKISEIKAGNNDGNSGSSTPSTDTSTVDETVAIDQETLTRLMPAVTGMVTFAEIVSMYEKIGNNLPVQSSEAGQYGLIGVVQENGKYYYKLLDTKTGKVYFTEINEKSKINWDEKGERKVVEVKDENAMILNKTGESDDGLVRFADKGDVYLLTDDKTTVDGIDYYNIMDSKTDTNAYMVSSDSVSQPKSISDLISAVGDSEVIK